jgi:hypothetical protein
MQEEFGTSSGRILMKNTSILAQNYALSLHCTIELPALFPLSVGFFGKKLPHQHNRSEGEERLICDNEPLSMDENKF